MNKSPLGSKIMAATSTTTIDTITERKMENATEGLPSRCLGLVQRMLPANRDNVLSICDYIQSLKSEINPSNNYRRDVIDLLCKFSAFSNNKSFKEITREFWIVFAKLKALTLCINGLVHTTYTQST